MSDQLPHCQLCGADPVGEDHALETQRRWNALTSGAAPRAERPACYRWEPIGGDCTRHYGPHAILEEAEGGPWKPEGRIEGDDADGVWLVNEGGDSLWLTGNDVALLLNSTLASRPSDEREEDR